ncbi:ECF-type sigma factor [Rubrivirga sp. IMCC43871]|uniref:ECF-type sigma factor n=1 Tax=Rubrivirga sp. IMCC43871 TaxID=3391575 RepID=UPI00398FAC71
MAHDVTVLLDRVRAGDAAALDQVVEQLYDELRSVAHRQRVRNGAAPTVNTTAVVHEAYAKLAGRSAVLDLSDREHFVRVAARAMRDVIVDYARAQATDKRGGDGRAASLDALREVGVTAVSPHVDLDEALTVDAALDQLATLDAEAARVAELRYFTGLTNDEVAEVMGLSPATTKRRWTVARAWLARQLADDDPS